MILTLATIIFREIFEIALILCLVIFTAKKHHDIRRIVFFGFLFGISGSIVVGMLVEQISALFQGFGQEVFNASILFITAILMISVLLSINNPKVLKDKFSNEASEVGVIFLLAFTILREGSEIVLLTYSYILTNNLYDVLLGCLIGFAVGIAFSLFIYFGLSKIAIKRVFAIINWLLIFVVAGLVANGFLFLVAGGVVEYSSKAVFDISGIFPDNNMFGSFMGSIFGYNAKPTLSYLVVYFSSLSLVIFAYLRSSSKLKNY